MNGDEILAKIVPIICDVTGCERDSITRDSRIRDDLHLESLDAIEAAIRIEEASRVRLEDRVFSRFHTIGDVVDYLSQHGTENT